MRRESGIESGFTAHGAAREEHRPGPTGADPLHEEGGDDRGADPEVDLGVAELCLGVGEGEVADHHESASAADRGALDAGDGRDVQSADPSADRGQSAEHVAHQDRIVLHRLQVHAGAEALARPGEHHHPDLIEPRFDLAEGLLHRRDHLEGEGVPGVRSIERECRDGAVGGERDEFGIECDGVHGGHWIDFHVRRQAAVGLKRVADGSGSAPDSAPAFAALPGEADPAQVVSTVRTPAIPEFSDHPPATPPSDEPRSDLTRSDHHEAGDEEQQPEGRGDGERRGPGSRGGGRT